MKSARQPAELLSPGKPVCAAIGVFDGVHLGHQHILCDLQHHAVRLGALAVAVTFDRHPNAVVAPDRTPLLIQTLTQRLDAFARLALDATWIITFDLALSRLTGEEFVALLAQSFGRLASIHVGEQFHFGCQRSGHVGLLRQLESRFGFTTHSLPALVHQGHPVSSTRIRQAIREGDLDTARQMLGRPYALAGLVMPGDGRGRQLGFPTANLAVSGLALPPAGVYVARARWADRTADAAVSIGRRPTIGAAAHTLGVEAHLLDTQADLYGQELELTLTARLRDERAFTSLDALKEQIARDVAAARAMLASPPG